IPSPRRSLCRSGPQIDIGPDRGSASRDRRALDGIGPRLRTAARARPPVIPRPAIVSCRLSSFGRAFDDERLGCAATAHADIMQRRGSRRPRSRPNDSRPPSPPARHQLRITMVAVLDDYAWQEALALIDHFGDDALGWAVARASDLAERGEARTAGLWSIIAFAVGELQRAREAARPSRGAEAEPTGRDSSSRRGNALGAMACQAAVRKPSCKNEEEEATKGHAAADAGR